MNHRRITRFVFTTVSVLAASAMLITLVVASSQIDIHGPTGSEAFGTSVAVLPNGNLVVCDPGYDTPGAANVGAAYLYDGESGALISTLTGSTAGDQVCNDLITLTNGNFVIVSTHWDNGDLADVGAVTWASGVAGVSGVVSPENSLVGGSTDDRIGSYLWGGFSTWVLDNGNYMVYSQGWDNGPVVDAGAITFANGATGITGVVSARNSLVGSTSGDLDSSCSSGNTADMDGQTADLGAPTWRDGSSGLVSAGDSLVSSPAYDPASILVAGLSNDNTYAIVSRCWDNGPAVDAGAVTWVNTTTGITGPISPANSLVGVTTGDNVGLWGIWKLGNGNYLVLSPFWDNGPAENAGAVTWVNAKDPITGPVSPANSLVGSSTNDGVGSSSSVWELANGNYLVTSASWDNGPVADVGAVTWGNGNTGVTGPVSAANSLVGSTAGDQVGGYYSSQTQGLANGDYLVRSPLWDNGPAADAGAVTWGNGRTGITGTVSAANSLVGSSKEDMVGRTPAVDLGNGNYVISSSAWDNGAAVDAGAVTWVDGETGITGAISAANSLVGGTTDDQIGGYYNFAVLPSGNFVISSPDWDNGSAVDAGAATWVNGSTGITGTISAANSLVGTKTGDLVGSGRDQEGSVRSIILTNGNYIVTSPNWDNGLAIDAGAVTWSSGTAGITGTVSAANSLVGSTADDKVGLYYTYSLSNGNYIVLSPYWDNGAATDAGAVTWGSGTSGVSGPVSAANSLVGSTAGDKVGINGALSLANGNYVVSSPYWDNGVLTDAGAVTWGDGNIGVTGPISAANSLVGDSNNELLGKGYEQPIGKLTYYVRPLVSLTNGNYVVVTPDWDNGPAVDAGAITWGNGEMGTTGMVSEANSLVGSTTGDLIGYSQVTALPNGNYLVGSPYWDNGAASDAGAVTWGDGNIGVTGPISAANSLVGSSSGDLVGKNYSSGYGLPVLNNGDYLLISENWDNGSAQDAGAITWGGGAAGVRGTISAANSVLGQAAGGGHSIWYLYDDHNSQFVVGRPADNTVTLFRPNLSPVADAGWPQSVERGDLVRLDGSASYDPDGNLPLRFTWTQTEGPPVVLSDPHAVSPTFTAPDERTVLTFNLVVTDALGSSSKPARAIVFVDPYQYFWPLMPEH